MTESRGTTETGQDLVLTREFDAPRELVWRVWSEPEHYARWMGPKEWTISHCEIDFRVGGRVFMAMRGPDGNDIWNIGVYQEIVPLERIVSTDSFADEHGNVVPASHYGMSEAFPLEMRIMVTFEDLGGRTRMTLRHSGIPGGPDIEGATEGWNQTLDKLAEYLAEVS